MCGARLATGPLPRGSGSGVPVRVFGRGHAFGVIMGIDVPIPMCMDMRVYVCVRSERACTHLRVHERVH